VTKVAFATKVFELGGYGVLEDTVISDPEATEVQTPGNDDEEKDAAQVCCCCCCEAAN